MEERFLVWCDLETDGIEPGIIVELACIVTDNKLNELGTFYRLVSPPEGYVWDTESYAYKMHTDNGLLDALDGNARPVAEVERDFASFLTETVGEQPEKPKERTAFLAGNSVHFDHRFLSACLVPIPRFFHYRLLDVSAMRMGMEVALGRKLEPPGEPPHRALEDIRGSIHMFKNLWNLYQDVFANEKDFKFAWED